MLERAIEGAVEHMPDLLPSTFGWINWDASSTLNGGNDRQKHC